MEDESREFDPPEIIAPSKDWFLVDLVEMVNSGDVYFGVTLTVGGSLVSGNLISGKAYFDDFAQKFSSISSDQASAEKLKNHFSKFGRVYEEDLEQSDKSKPLPVFIHLKDARVFNGAVKGIPSSGGSFWRGRLSEVSGFILGSMSES